MVKLDHQNSVLALLPHSCCVILDKLLNFTASKISHLLNKIIKKNHLVYRKAGRLRCSSESSTAPADGSCAVAGGLD